ncbi:MAG: ABC transporter permease [Solirubrobacteraceae bacterium]
MATTTPSSGTEFSSELAFAGDDGGELPPGIGPWKLAWRRLRRNKVAMFFGGVFILIVVVCFLAPVYSHDVAHISPSDDSHIDHPVVIGGKKYYALTLTGTPIGPTWHSQFLLGADEQGRDLAVRLLYGGRTSLEIGVVATLITMVFGLILGTIGGYFRGFADGVIRFILDLLWAFPVVILGVALGVTLALGGIGPLKGNSLLVPAVVVGIVYIPYVGRPVRGQVLGLREREYIDAARQQGLSNLTIMMSEVLPNLASTIVVFLPLILANAILLEAGLSYLGAGVQPPNASWGTLIAAGVNKIPAGFHAVLVPGLMLVLCVMSINIFGDGVRDALDPRAKVRIGR